jgi:isoamylase
MPYVTTLGTPQPLGTNVLAGAVNFSLFSQHATAVQLLLFASPIDLQPTQIIDLGPPTQFYWHTQVQGLLTGTAYAYRVSGPSGPGVTEQFGHRFDPTKVLIDPYALGNTDTLWQAGLSVAPGDNVATSMRSLVIDSAAYDWQGDAPPNTPLDQTIVYELHARGFTRSPTSATTNPGTFAALIEKLPYIKSLGVTAIELMPIFDFDEKTPKHIDPVTGAHLNNFWGYDPISFFAVQSAYCVSPNTATHIHEFRDFVKATHSLGLEVILDVVFNHTGEDGNGGSIIDFKGIDNSLFYFLQRPDQSQYRGDLTGCPNALRCNHPFVTKMLEEALAYWVSEMHVDGFRFDLGAVLTLGEDAQKLQYPPIVWGLNLDPRFAYTKVIVEPFGGNSGDVLGSFPDIAAATWNYQFRNTIRQFVRGDQGITSQVATRVCGSSDLFQPSQLGPLNGVSYITCHDGFTLNDVVSYNMKHNEANLEDSGDDNNNSSNYGIEGPTPDPTINALREQQVRNFLAMLFLSQGVPMLLGGDECRRTQQGNNNPYIQDNPISWFDWTLTRANAGLVAFTQGLIAFRKQHPALSRSTFFTGQAAADGLKDIAFHGCNLNQPSFGDPSSRVLAFTLGGGEPMHVILNMELSSLPFELPIVAGKQWFRAVDTSLAYPQAIAVAGQEVQITTASYYTASRSVVVLIAK